MVSITGAQHGTHRLSGMEVVVGAAKLQLIDLRDSWFLGTSGVSLHVDQPLKRKEMAGIPPVGTKRMIAADQG